MWQPINTAPFDRDLQLAVLNEDGENALVFACRRVSDGWMNVRTHQRIEIHPTHWRPWREEQPQRH